MFQYEDLMWLISFPLVCAVMLWFSLDLAVLVRVGGGRRRRANARRAIERLIMNSAVCATVSVVQSPPSFATPASGAQTETPNPWRGADHTRHPSYSSTDAECRSPRSPRSPLSSLQQQQQRYQKVRQVAIPAALRIATRAVVRRAVVMVGGDFARSPRMQYHAASLARSGLFDEILLVGLDCGNQLSEDLLISGEPQAERFVTLDGASKAAAGGEQAVYDVQARLSSPHVQAGHGCIISTRYLATPPTPPEWLQAVVPLRSLHWVVCTLYRVVALTLRFVLQLGRVTATRINEHGQLLVTDLILVQTPPAVPFILLVKYLVCPLVFVYNMLLYYCVVVPAAWMNPDAMRDMRHECRLQSLRFETGEGAGEGEEERDGPTTHGTLPPSLSTSPSHVLSAAASKVAASVCRRLRPWVFYPALVVDWHNYGYTILEQNQRPTTAVQLYKLLEVHLCAGHVNVTVSQAMRASLESFYPWMKRRAPAGVASSPSPTEQRRESLHNGSAASHDNEGGGTAGHAAPQSAVTVLYDVAPSFFRPFSRQRCVREVLDRLLLRNSATPQATAATAAATHGDSSKHHGTSVMDSSAGLYALVSLAELESAGWGIAGPPAWVYADAAAEPAASPHGSPMSPLPPSPTFGPPSAASQRRGIVMVGSTSWTEDDDYSVLIRALQRLDHRLNHEVPYYTAGTNGSSGSNGSGGGGGGGGATPLDLWVLITGKGPARKRFEDAVRAAKLSPHVVVSTYYAQSYQEYSLLLGAADVGFCLHFSSSGLDLPMKGVDMVGAGLPVIALQYPAIEELMGGATRVLAQSRAIPPRGMPQCSPSSSSSSSQPQYKAPAALVECERGWVFRGDVDLEVLLSSFVGLPAMEPPGSWLSGSRGGNGTGSGGAGGGAAAPTPLAVMQRRAYEARLHATTWNDNWTQVLLPVLKQVV